MFTVIVLVPIILNSIQFIIQDMFLKKNDFEITDIDILKTFYSSIQNEELDISFTGVKDNNGGTELDSRTAVPSSVLTEPVISIEK